MASHSYEVRKPIPPQRGWGRQPPISLRRHSLKVERVADSLVTAFWGRCARALPSGDSRRHGRHTRRPQRCIPPRTSPAQGARTQGSARCPGSGTCRRRPRHGARHARRPPAGYGALPSFPRHPAQYGQECRHRPFPLRFPRHIAGAPRSAARHAPRAVPKARFLLRSPPHEGIHRDTADRAYAGKVCLPRQDVPGT